MNDDDEQDNDDEVPATRVASIAEAVVMWSGLSYLQVFDI